MQNATTWLEKLCRILVPGGILIVTTHGISANEIIRDSVVHQKMFGLDRTAINDTVDNNQKGRFIFHKYNKDALQDANPGDEYGNAFIHPDYIRINW